MGEARCEILFPKVMICSKGLANEVLIKTSREGDDLILDKRLDSKRQWRTNEECTASIRLQQGIII
jgi:hypothetical protein